MDCRRVDDWLPAYVEDALPSRRARAVTAHLEDCPRCRRERRMLESALGALDRVGSRAPAIDLWGSFADRLAAEQAARPRTLWEGTVVLRRPFALAGSLALAVGACFLGLMAGGPGFFDPPSPTMPKGGHTASAWRGMTQLAAADRPTASPVLRGLPPVASPENQLSVTRPSVRVAEASPQAVANATGKRPLPVELFVPAVPPERSQLAAIPSAELASVADALIDAQEDAARTQVANEVLVLAEEMLRVSTPREPSGEERS